MIMLGLQVKQVRLIIGRFCRIYDIPEDQDRDLSRSIAATVKKYKEMKGSASFQDLVWVSYAPIITIFCGLILVHYT
jgi:hypothetical protein